MIWLYLKRYCNKFYIYYLSAKFLGYVYIFIFLASARNFLPPKGIFLSRLHTSKFPMTLVLRERYMLVNTIQGMLYMFKSRFLVRQIRSLRKPRRQLHVGCYKTMALMNKKMKIARVKYNLVGFSAILSVQNNNAK